MFVLLPMNMGILSFFNHAEAVDIPSHCRFWPTLCTFPLDLTGSVVWWEDRTLFSYPKLKVTPLNMYFVIFLCTFVMCVMLMLLPISSLYHTYKKLSLDTVVGAVTSCRLDNQSFISSMSKSELHSIQSVMRFFLQGVYLWLFPWGKVACMWSSPHTSI